jgi:hypothetical protein
MTGGTSRPPDAATPGGVTPDDPERDGPLPDDEDEGRDVSGLSRWQRWGYGLADRLQSADPRRWWDAFIEPAKPAPPDLTPYDTDDDEPPGRLPPGVLPDEVPPAPTWPSVDEDDPQRDAPPWPDLDPDPEGPPAVEPRPEDDEEDEVEPASSHPSPHVSPHPREQHQPHPEPITTGSATMAVDASQYTENIDLSTPESRFSSCMTAAERARTDAARCEREAQEFFDEAAKLDTVPGSTAEAARLRREAESLKEDRDRRRAIAAGLEKRAGAAPQPVTAGTTR